MVLAQTDGALLSTVNLFEALAKARRNRDLEPALLVEELRNLHIQFVDFSETQAVIAAKLPFAANGRPLAMADRACLSLAIERQIAVLTGDHDWRALEIGIPILFFR